MYYGSLSMDCIRNVRFFKKYQCRKQKQQALSIDLQQGYNVLWSRPTYDATLTPVAVRHVKI